LAEPIEELLKSENLREEIGNKAYSYIAIHHEANIVTKRLINVLVKGVNE